MNLRKILLIFLFLGLLNCSAEQTLQAGTKYNEVSAKIEAFRDLSGKIDKKFFENYLKDPNYKENIEAIRNGERKIATRQLCPFYIKSNLALYAVLDENNPKNTFYYNILGNLVKIDLINQNDYPHKVLSYSRRANLLSVSFCVDENEQFIYNRDGELIAHWKDNKIVKGAKIPMFLRVKRGENQEF